MIQIIHTQINYLTKTFISFVLLFITLIFFMSFNEVHASIEETAHSDACYKYGVQIGPCKRFTIEKHYDNATDAKSACDTWLQGLPGFESDDECDDANFEPLFSSGHHEDPQCLVLEKGVSLTCDYQFAFLGNFYHPTCPIGTTLDLERGCIQEDEPKECKIQAGNPINTATGSKYHTERIDLGSDILELSLEYTSNHSITPYGKKDFNTIAPGWNYSYRFEISAVKKAHGIEFVMVKRPNGRNIRYEYDETSQSWITKLASDGKLVSLTDGWEFIAEDGIEYYDLPSSGYGKSQITQKVLHSGHTLSFQYKSGYISRVTDDFGNFIFFKALTTTDIGYRIREIEHSDGRQWTLRYHSTNHNLETIEYPDGTLKTFHYDDVDPVTSNPRHIHALTGITSRHPDGQTGTRFATYEYDADRRVIKEWHHAKDLAGTDIKVEELTILYDPTGYPAGTRKITNSLGEISYYEVEEISGIWQIKSITGPGCSSCSNDNTTFVYDPMTNDLISKTQDGVITKYFNYDDKGQYAYKIEAFGTTDAKRTDYTYDSRFIGKVTSITEASVLGTNNKVNSYVYDANGQLTSMTESGFKPDGTAISKTTTYEYNGPFNQISRIDGPRAGNIDETVYEYYPDTNPVPERRNRLKRVTGPEDILERNRIRWSATGKVTEEERPNGIIITNNYDPLNDRLVSSTQTDGLKSLVTQFSYLTTGHIESVTRNYGTPEASTLTLTYDDALRVTRVTDELGNYVEYDLDTEGNQLSENTHDPSGVLKKQITQIFDPYDFVDSMTQSGVTIDYNYGSNGVLNNQTNGNNVTTDYSYDNLKRLTQINQDYNGTNSATANTITGFTYDAGERVKTVTDARGNVTTYNFDDFGNLISLVSPDTGTTSYVYDLAGNMTSKTDANGTTVTMSYDGRNRITSIDYADNSLDTSYIYDQGVNGTGKLASFIDQTGSTTISYDSFGNLLSKAQVVTGFNGINYVGFNNLTTTYTYDSYNRLATLTYPSGLTLNYEYDDLNQVNKIITSVNGQTETVVDQVGYLPFGPVDAINFGNGKNYSANYDGGYRLLDYSYGTDVTAVYTYDNNHNITAITREVAANNDGFSYDELDRLTYDSHDLTTLTYDKLGNRTSKQQGSLPATNYIIDGNSNKLLNAGSGKPRDYDANGNTRSIRDLNNYDWIYNQANRMSGFKIGKTLVAEYAHNGIGQRVHKTVGGYDYLYIYDEQGQLVHESKYGLPNGSFSNALLWDRETIWLGNRPVAQVRTTYYGGMNQDIHYIQTDHLNTPRWITDDAGVRIWTWESDAFGTSAPNEDVDGDSTNFEFNMRFPGQFFDVESGMHYNYFRDYEPGTGRYLESDPIGLDGGINTFGYALSNPLFYSDPFGLFCITTNPCVERIYMGNNVWGCKKRAINIECYSEPNQSGCDGCRQACVLSFFLPDVGDLAEESTSATSLVGRLVRKVTKIDLTYDSLDTYKCWQDCKKDFIDNNF